MASNPFQSISTVSATTESPQLSSHKTASSQPSPVPSIRPSPVPSKQPSPVPSKQPSPVSSKQPTLEVCLTTQDLQSNANVGSFTQTIQGMQIDIATLKAELNSYKQPTCQSKNSSREVCPKSVPPCVQSNRSQAIQNRQPMATSTAPNEIAPNETAPVCMCGVTNLQEENVRLRRGLVAKHNEVIHLRGLMMNTHNYGINGSRLSPYQQVAPNNPWSGTMLPYVCRPETRLAAGGMSSSMNGSGNPSVGGSYVTGSYPAGVSLCPGGNNQTSYCTSVSDGRPCHMPGCPFANGAQQASRSNNNGYQQQQTPGVTFNQGALTKCNTSASASRIIEESKRQMEETENEIKSKLHEIKDKKNELEEDISKLQNVLIAKQQEATKNMQAASAVKAAQIAQAAKMAIESQKLQTAQAQEAAKSAAELKEAQDEQSRKQALAAQAAEMAQQAQYHQLQMAGQAAEAAERAGEAQKQQAAQAEEASRAAELVKTAQEEQNRIVAKQLLEAERLKNDQEEQNCKTAQATEALHAAHVAQVAQQAQACEASTQARSVLTQHKFIPTPVGCEELERSMRTNTNQQPNNTSNTNNPNNTSNTNGERKCCNPNCPNNKQR